MLQLQRPTIIKVYAVIYRPSGDPFTVHLKQIGILLVLSGRVTAEHDGWITRHFPSFAIPNFPFFAQPLENNKLQKFNCKCEIVRLCILKEYLNGRFNLKKQPTSRFKIGHLGNVSRVHRLHNHMHLFPFSTRGYLHKIKLSYGRIVM